MRGKAAEPRQDPAQHCENIGEGVFDNHPGNLRGEARDQVDGDGTAHALAQDKDLGSVDVALEQGRLAQEPERGSRIEADPAAMGVALREPPSATIDEEQVAVGEAREALGEVDAMANVPAGAVEVEDGGAGPGAVGCVVEVRVEQCAVGAGEGEYPGQAVPLGGLGQDTGLSRVQWQVAQIHERLLVAQGQEAHPHPHDEAIDHEEKDEQREPL